MRAGSLSIFAVLALAAIAYLALCFTAQDLVRRRERIDRRDVAIPAALFAVALALRWFLPVHTLIHENHHGYQVDPLLPLDLEVTRSGMVYGQLVLVKLYAYLAPHGREPVFELNVIASALAVPGMYALARQLFADRLAAWSSAIWLVLQPISILMAPTEEFLVTASGLCLAGMPLVWLGARERLLAPLVAGASLIGLAACARDVTLPLAALAPITVLCAAPPSARLPWRAAIGVAIALAIPLAPFAIGVLLATRAQGGTPGFVHLPRVPFFDARWVGWRAPHVPLWMGAFGVASLAALAIEAARKPDLRRGAIVALAAFTIAQAAGGVVQSTWFPSMLRHQLFAMALLVLPMGWLYARLVERAPRPAIQRLAWALPPALGVASLIAAPNGHRTDGPLAREYRFFDDAVRALPDRMRAARLAHHPERPDHLPEAFFWSRRPAWEIAPASELAALARRGSDRPVVLLLDRACFVDLRCIDGRRGCREDAPLEGTEPTPYGRAHRDCAEALRAVPWTEHARLPIARPEDPAVDLPSMDREVTLAVLVWDGRAARESR